MNLRLFRLSRYLLTSASLTWHIQAQEMLEPPFGLRWGDSPEKLIQWAVRHELDVTILIPGEQPTLRILKIQPKKGKLPDTEASGIEGRFLTGKLFEVTVHYSDPGIPPDQMAIKFAELKKQISLDLGTLQPDQQSKTVVDNFVSQTDSFFREPVKGLILLFAATQFEDVLRKVKSFQFSLVYRNENLRCELQRNLEQP